MGKFFLRRRRLSADDNASEIKNNIFGIQHFFCWAINLLPLIDSLKFGQPGHLLLLIYGHFKQTLLQFLSI